MLVSTAARRASTCSTEGALRAQRPCARVERAHSDRARSASRRTTRLPFLFLLLNRREPPLPFLDSHEGPGFAGFSRYLFAAFDEIAWFSVLLRQRQVVVTGTPAQPCRHVLPRLFGPDLQDLRTEEHHILDVVLDVLTGIVGQGGAEIIQHLRRDELPQLGQILVAPGFLNIDQELLKVCLVGGGHTILPIISVWSRRTALSADCRWMGRGL